MDTFTWPDRPAQFSNLVEVINDPSGIPHAEYGEACRETWRRAPKAHRQARHAIGDDFEWGQRPCGQPGRLQAFELGEDDDWDHYVPIYLCPDHS